MEKAINMGDYIKVIKDGEEFRRYSSSHWEQRFLSDKFEPIMVPMFLEHFYQKFLKNNKVEDK